MDEAMKHCVWASVCVCVIPYNKIDFFLLFYFTCIINQQFAFITGLVPATCGFQPNRPTKLPFVGSSCRRLFILSTL